MSEQAPNGFSLREKIAAGVTAAALAVGAYSAVKNEQTTEPAPLASIPAETAPQAPLPLEAAPEAQPPQATPERVKVITVKEEVAAEPVVIHVTRTIKENASVDGSDTNTDSQNDKDTLPPAPQPGDNPDNDTATGGEMPVPVDKDDVSDDRPYDEYPVPPRPAPVEPGTKGGDDTKNAPSEVEKQNIETAKTRFSNEFYTDKERQIVNGYTYFPMGKDMEFAVESAEIEIYDDLGIAVFGWHKTHEEPGNPADDLMVLATPISSFPGLVFGPLDAETPLAIGKTHGAINDQLGDEEKSFTATSGVRFGIEHLDMAFPGGTHYGAVYENGQLNFVERSPK